MCGYDGLVRTSLGVVALSIALSACGGTSQAPASCDEAGLGEGPYALRVTDVYGAAVEDQGVPLLDDADHPSSAQLPACSP